MTCDTSNFCSKGAGRKVWMRKPSPNWQRPDSTWGHWQDNQTGWATQPPLLTRHHQLPCIHGPTNGNIQMQQPSNSTTGCRPSHNPKLRIPTHTHNPRSPTLCSRQTYSNCVLLSLASWRIHPPRPEQTTDPTILPLRHEILCQQHRNPTRSTTIPPPVYQPRLTNYQQPEKWKTRQNLIPPCHHH